MEFILTRYCLQKGLAFLYIVAFLIVSCQYLGLYGKQGLLPLEKRKQHLRFWQTPSLFCVYCSDRFLRSMASAGLVLALFAFSGYSESMGLIVSMVTWFLLWALYQSFVNVGEVFYGFGWEILLLEAGFLAIFLGSAEISPPLWIIWLYRFLLFRVMLGAGLIKMRGDACWKDLTALMFHYETQPLPGPLSCFFHRMPAWFHRGGVLVNHFVELIVPFFFFWPEQAASVAALITIGFQGVLILSGNLSWLNYITIVISFSCLGDTFWSKVLPWMTSLQVAAPPVSYQIVVVGVTLLLLTLSIRPMRNLVSPGQRMNCSFDPLHLVNTYGAFGSMTRVRR
ncbi:MAG: lipase maturation factor family protein, partial [Chlamydiae bacterium]|nr:lipase maturation factor family protein [Chlamydiota bacterium]